MSDKSVDITPDKSLIKKLGLVGYRTEQAVAELVDNSIDARLDCTEHIDVLLDYKMRRIIVSDDGSGMGLDGLRDALTIAKETKGNEKLGRFGLGMKSACSSLGKAFALTTSTPGSRSIFTAKYDEDRWLKDDSQDWTNFGIEEYGKEDDWHGTVITISRVNVPLYPNQILNFRKRFGIRYGPYITDGQVRIRINSRECPPHLPEMVEGSKRPVEITVPGGHRLAGWIGLLTHRSIKGDYGIHLYRNKRLISVFDKFGIRHHPDAAMVVGKLSLDHVPVNFHKTGFLVESPEYLSASHYFIEHPAVKMTLREASASRRVAQDVQSVLSFDPDQDLPALNARMSSANTARLLQDAGRVIQQKDGTTFIFEFDDSSTCHIERVGAEIRVGIGRQSGVFRLFKNPLFLIALIRIEAELAAEGQPYQDFVERLNRMLEQFVADRLPKLQSGSKARRNAVPLLGYTLQSRLIELHDYLQENFEHGFQFTGLSTLAPFLQNAYGVLVYSVHTINGAGQSLLESIADHSGEFTVLLNPQRREFETLLKATTSSTFIAVREYEEKPTPTWAGPEKAWLDLYFEVTRDIIPIYQDELIIILGELLDRGLAKHAKIRSLARRKRILGEISAYLPEG